jgi:hypothetical protein
MDKLDVQAELNRFLAPDTRCAIVAAMDTAYRNAGSRYDPTVGSDPQLQGFTIYKFGMKELSRVVADPAYGIRNASSGGQFRLGFGPFLMTPYGCGHSAPDDPWKHFPNNDQGAGMLSDINTGQLSLGDGFGDEALMAVVLAHYGNPDAGLEALYLKVPMDKENGRISAWSYVEPLWRIGGEATRPSSSPDLPRPVVVAPPVLTLKKPITKPDADTA